MKQLYIFGASKAGEKTAQMLQSMGISFYGFLDNNMKKWRTFLMQKEIMDPAILLTLVEPYEIIIASDYYEEIEAQLIEMEIPLSYVHSRESYVLQALKGKDQIPLKSRIDHDITYVIDLAEGYRLGGIETWSCVVAKSMKELKKSCIIYSKNENPDIPKPYQVFTEPFSFAYDKMKENIEEVKRKMEQSLPCVVLVNWYTQVFYAACSLKETYGEAVKIIGVVHHDMLRYYRRNQEIQKEFDSFLCVSNKVRERMITEFQIPDHKVAYFPSPVISDFSTDKYYTKFGEPIRIGFGSRLVKAQKRTDLLPEVLEQLAKRNISYKMQIAGDGNYRETLELYVKENKFEKNVTFVGILSQEEMVLFWKNQDIMISLSDSEGIGLSILEAMCQGTVPIVTKTAGIDDFVTDMETGFVCAINDVESIVNVICNLYQNRSKLQSIGTNAKKLIQATCNPEVYINKIVELTQTSHMDFSYVP